jgi:putative transposase
LRHIASIEASARADRIHMYAAMPPKLSAAMFMGRLKGRSATAAFKKFARAKRKSFWSGDCYADAVGKSGEAMAEYARNWMNADKNGQTALKEYIDPFAGKPCKEQGPPVHGRRLGEKIRAVDTKAFRLALTVEHYGGYPQTTSFAGGSD